MARNAADEVSKVAPQAVPQVPRISPDDGFVTPEKPALSTEPTPDNGAVQISKMITTGDKPYSQPRPLNREQQTPRGK